MEAKVWDIYGTMKANVLLDNNKVSVGDRVVIVTNPMWEAFFTPLKHNFEVGIVTEVWDDQVSVQCLNGIQVCFYHETFPVAI